MFQVFELIKVHLSLNKVDALLCCLFINAVLLFWRIWCLQGRGERGLSGKSQNSFYAAHNTKNEYILSPCLFTIVTVY